MEDFWKTVHWFATSACNENCVYCFKPEFKNEDSEQNTTEIAKTLVAGGVEKVVFTRGEPFLLKSLDAGLETLKQGGLDVSIHTNATLLTPKRIKELLRLVDEIAIPVDSLDRSLQTYLRQKDCLPKVKQVFKQLQDLEVRIGIHTVATPLNIDHIPQIYKFLSKNRFDYWKIYEFNPDLVSDRFQNVPRFTEIESLRGQIPTTEDGGVNCLFADFLLTEEQIFKHKDKGVQFVGVSDYNREPYFFLTTAGDVYFCNWFLQGKRKHIGNILEESFETVREKAIEADRQGPLFDEESFVDAINDRPLWVRTAWEGNYFSEELEDIDPIHYEKFGHLTTLSLNRLKRQGAAPEDAELAIKIS